MRIAARPGHPLLDKSGKKGGCSLRDLVGASWLYMTAHDSSDDIVSRSFIASGLPVPLAAVHCGSYFVALDLLASIDMVGVLPPALLRSCMQSGQLVELVLAHSLIPIQLGLYTRSGSPPTAPAKSAAAAIIAISKRLALTGELRSTAPLKA
jgi:DNA-binding transcriptional LysR family regulator